MTHNTESPAGDSDADAVRAEIDATRSDLAETVDALADKLDVKKRTGEKITGIKERVSQTAASAKQAAPPQVQRALDRTGEKLGPLAQQASAKAAPHRGKIFAVVAAGIVVVMLLASRRRRNDSDQSLN